MSLRQALGNTGGFGIALLCGFLALNHFHAGIAPEFEKYLTYDTRRLLPAFRHFYIENVSQLQTILALLLTNAACFSIWQPTRWLGLRIASFYFVAALAAQTYIGDSGQALMSHSLILAACIVFGQMIA